VYPNLPECGILCLSLLFINAGGTMKPKRFLIQFAIVFAVILVVNATVVYLWNLIGHGQGTFDWETLIRFAIILGIALPVIKAMTSKEK